jgi:ribosomal protein S18 acetylase RimI-like enzyme
VTKQGFFIWRKAMEKEQVPQFIIRKGLPTDAVGARKMQAESWLATYPNQEAGVSNEWVKDVTDQWLTPENLERSQQILKAALDDSTAFYRLAENGEKIVGFVHAATNDDGTKELEAIYTSPETFGSGLGQQLMDVANEWIGDIDVTLKVAIYNERAIRFYEKNGFKVVEGTEELYKEMIPIVQMKRKGEKS